MRFTVALVASLFVLIVALTPVSAQAPDSLGFQGLLTDTNGITVTNGNYDLLVKMYKGSSKIWEQNHVGVPVKSGIFNLILSGTTTYPLDTVAFNQPIDLGITINGGDEMTPRTPLTSAAYARGMPGLYTFYRNNGGSKSYNVIGGAPNNVVGPNVAGATIGGGGGSSLGPDIPFQNSVLKDFGTVGGGDRNTASGLSATVGGGSQNTASGVRATVGGGYQNTASEQYATISGGSENTASGDRATVPGGRDNRASGDYSFAAGRAAKAIHQGTFVWNDRLDSLASTGTNQFLIRAAGGVGVGINQPGADLHIGADSHTAKPHILLQEQSSSGYARLRLKNDSNIEYWDVAAGSTDNDILNFYSNQGRNNVMSLRATGTPLVMYNGATLTHAGIWTNVSSQSRKTDFVEINSRTVLEDLASLPVRQWRYKVESKGVIHIGPTAEDFHEMFGLGESTETIGTVDSDGVALAAIQGLYELVQDQQAEMERMRAAMARAGIE